MSKSSDVNYVKLRTVNMLLSSGFHMLKASPECNEFLADPDEQNKLGDYVYKAKGRFTTFNGIVSAFPEQAYSEVTCAVIQSFKDYFEVAADIIFQHSEYFKDIESEAETFLSECIPLPEELKTYNAKETNKTSKHIIQMRKDVKSTHGMAFAYYLSLIAANILLDSLQISPLDKQKIVREIRFPKDLTQAGVGLLTYFSKILEQKYPNIDVSVSIKQTGHTVTMTVELPDGSLDEISHTLTQYGLVLSNKASPEDIFENKLHALELKQRLRLAEIEVTQSREILALEKERSGERIDSLEQEVGFLRELVSKSMDTNLHVQQKLIDSITEQVGTEYASENEKILNRLVKAISNNERVSTKIMLEDIHTTNPDLFSKLKKIVLEGAISGIVGNAAFSWIEEIFKSLM